MKDIFLVQVVKRGFGFRGEASDICLAQASGLHRGWARQTAGPLVRNRRAVNQFQPPSTCARHFMVDTIERPKLRNVVADRLKTFIVEGNRIDPPVSVPSEP